MMKSRPTKTRLRTSYQSSDASFKSTKEDRRRMKRSSLLVRILSTHSKVKKRRRPSKKPMTSLDSLAKALPGNVPRAQPKRTNDSFQMTHKSLKSRPGALKKKEKLAKMERERFEKNMVQMAKDNRSLAEGVPASHGEEGSAINNTSSHRWAALRGFIVSTMDRDLI